MNLQALSIEGHFISSRFVKECKKILVISNYIILSISDQTRIQVIPESDDLINLRKILLHYSSKKIISIRLVQFKIEIKEILEADRDIKLKIYCNFNMNRNVRLTVNSLFERICILKEQLQLLSNRIGCCRLPNALISHKPYPTLLFCLMYFTALITMRITHQTFYVVIETEQKIYFLFDEDLSHIYDEKILLDENFAIEVEREHWLQRILMCLSD